VVTTNDQADLVLELVAAPRGAVDYAVVYACEVRRVVKGRLTMKTIFVTILNSDHQTLDDFHARRAPGVLEAGFKKHRQREPYAMMPLTGFVDDKRTSWRLVYVR